MRVQDRNKIEKFAHVIGLDMAKEQVLGIKVIYGLISEGGDSILGVLFM